MKPARTLPQVKNALRQARKTNALHSMARLLFKHGNLTSEAKAFVGRISLQRETLKEPMVAA